MTTEQLLQPRYEVIEDYPNSPFTVGQIIDFSEAPMFLSGNVTGNKMQGTDFYDKYPHLFRHLKWHERRKAEEMPLYLKCTDVEDIKDGEIVKVDRWDFTENEVYLDHDYVCSLYLGYDLGIEPATETEYLTYLNSQK